MLLLQTFLNNLLPILLVAAAGYLLAHFLELDTRTLGRIIYYILSPVLVFNLLMNSQVSLAGIARMLAFVVLVILSSGLLGYLGGRLLRLEKPVLMAVLLTVMFNNAGNYGLPLVEFAFGQEALAYAGVYFVSSAVLANIFGAVIASMGRTSFKRALLGVFKVPMLYGALLAVALLQLGWELPALAGRTVGLVAGASIPAMLLLLGMELHKADWRRHLKAISLGTAVRLIGGPLIGLGWAALFGFSGSLRQAAVVEAAMPTAVLTTVLAAEFDLEPGMVNSMVLISTLVSPLTLTPLLVFLG